MVATLEAHGGTISSVNGRQMFGQTELEDCVDRGPSNNGVAASQRVRGVNLVLARLPSNECVPAPELRLAS